MPTLRERFVNALLGDEKRKLEETTRALWRAYEDGPYLLSPQDLLTQLREIDSATIQDMVNQLAYEQIGTLGASFTDSDAERGRAVDESRRAYRYDPLTQWIIHLWTDFGFGETISITLSDQDAQDTFNDFWKADRNAALLAEDELQF